PEPVLFGLPLARAVVLAGVCVGRVASSGEDCVVPTVVAACGRHLWDRGQQTQGIFRVNGSMKRVQRLQAEFNAGPAYGRSVQWGGYTLHDAATMLRRYLTSLPESVIGSEHYSAFMDQLAATLPDEAKARAYGALIDQRLVPASRHTLLYMLELLSGFARPDNSARTLMNAANLAAVLQPCLLVHPGHIANPHEYTRAKDVVEFLIVHAAAMYAPRNGEPPAARLVMMDASPSASPATTDRMRAMTCGEQSVSGDCDHAAATNDDGATLDAYSNGPPSPHHHTRSTQWAQAPAHDSMSAAPYSPGPATMHGGAERMSAVPPNGTSAFRDNLAPNDGPRDAMHAADAAPMALSAPPQPLGSVTARLFDPAVAAGEPSSANGRLPLRPRMDTYDSWHAGQSGLAVNSIQYEHTATTAVRRPNRASLLAEPDSPVDVRSPTRPRRSMSFVVSSPTSDRQAIVSDHTGDSDGEQPTDDDDNDGYGDGRVDMDAFTHDIMSRSSNAARARRHAGERRAGHVNIHTPYTADTAQQGQKPLPPIPRPVGSGPSDDALRPTSASKLRRVGPFAGVAPEPTAAGFALYPRAQPTAAPAGSGADHPRAYAQVPATGPPHRMYRQSGTFAPGPVPDQDRPSKYGGAPASASQAWAAAPDAANGTRALWLSEDAPEDDYEFVGGRQPLWTQGAHSSESELHRYPAAASASTSAMGSGPPHGMADTQQQQQQPRHVFAGAHPDAVPIHRQGRSLTTGAMGNHEVAASQLNRHKVLHPAAATDSGKDKASMTRLKSLFRMGGVTTATGSSSNSSSSGGVGGSDSGNSKDPKKARVPVPGPLAVSNARADAAGQFSKTISSPRFTAKGFQQPSALGGLPRDAMPAGGSFEMASRLQVTVPAGHLSIVYPDSPMSKADTLRRSSDESYTNRMSAGIAAGSGRAYLVNPDDDADGADADIEPLSENGGQRFRGADLHSAPSNTTTLGPSSQLRQHPPPRVGMQDSYATLGGGSMSASGVGYMSSTTTFLTSRARDANVSGHDAGGNGSSGKPRLYAMHRLADSDTQIAQHHPHLSRSARGPSDADAFVLPSIGSGSPLMPAFGFDGRDFGSPPQQQARPYDAGREHRLAQQLLPSADDGDGDDGAGGSASAANSPRRSRSLRNTITSLRRKLSRSSRSSADVTPASLDDHAPTASVH
ncbi:GTPase activating protein (GAP) for Rho1p, partial [Coemansia spiralis]